MAAVAAFFFGGPLHARVQAFPRVDPNHLLGAPPGIMLMDPEGNEFGVYTRTADLEQGALVYRWDGPADWDGENLVLTIFGEQE